MIRKAIIVLLTLLCVATLIDSLSVYVTDSTSGRIFHAVDLGGNRSLWCRARLNRFNLMYFAIGDPNQPDVSHTGSMGFGVKRGRMYSEPKVYSRTMYAAFCPTWFLILCLGAYPLICLVRGIPGWRRNRRRRHGHCLKCGYNLTGNTSGVCPECGLYFGKQ
jgi:hypothetical protein